MDRRSFVGGATAAAATPLIPAMGLVSGFLGSSLLVPIPGFAQDAAAYPSRAVTFINPFPPGGAADVVGRPFAAVLEPIIR
jgi:tripartite-type tricarboxylate transporter receptor subunit TctC